MKKSTIFVGILGAILAIVVVSTSDISFAQSMGSGDTGGMTRGAGNMTGGAGNMTGGT